MYLHIYIYINKHTYISPRGSLPDRRRSGGTLHSDYETSQSRSWACLRRVRSGSFPCTPRNAQHRRRRHLRSRCPRRYLGSVPRE